MHYGGDEPEFRGGISLAVRRAGLGVEIGLFYPRRAF